MRDTSPNSTAIPHYNVRLALIHNYDVIVFQPSLGIARFPPTVTLFPPSFKL